ncbi:MAG: N-6 DNA methylase [Candidatus Gracilibacteria bacterium]|nr:N-6 DNA methylase [Candidatus Gracilibacteria bacterium]
MNVNILKIFEEIHNNIYANSGLSPEQILDEFIKILFIKIFTEKKGLNIFSVNNKDFLGDMDNYFNQIKSNYKNIFDKDDKIKLDPPILLNICKKFDGIKFNRIDNDIKGLAFQKILNRHHKVGKGQFFTPVEVVDFIVRFLNPTKNDKVLDLAVGSGGFLFSALNNMGVNKKSLNNVHGIDINKLVLKVSKMRLILEGGNEENIILGNSLSGEFDSKFNNYFDFILTNPPFGTQGKVNDQNILSNYELGYKWTKEGGTYLKTDKLLSGQAPEVLFIEKSINYLKEGGKMGIVLPNGYFENSTLGYVRNFIKSKGCIIGITQLPNETFIPYGTGVKTSILFFQKGGKASNDIFFSKIFKIGYQGNKNGTINYLKDNSGNYILNDDGNRIVDEDITEIFKKYNNLKNTDNTFFLPRNELEDKFNYDFYNPKYLDIQNNIKKGNYKRLKDVCDILKTKSEILRNKDELVCYVELGNVNTFAQEIINSSEMYVSELPSRASYQIKEGDIITSVAGNAIGTKKHITALVNNNYDGCICTNGFRVLRNFKVSKNYLLYYLQTDEFLQQVTKYKTGATIPSINDVDFGNLLIRIPNDNILKEISNKIGKSIELRNKANNIINDINFLK